MNEYRTQSRLEQAAVIIRLKSMANYRAGLRAAVRGLWNGSFDMLQFYEAMTSAIRRGFTLAWHEGMKEVGLAPEDMTPEEATQLDNMIIMEREFIFPFGDDIQTNSRENGGKLNPLLARVDKWIARYTNVKNQAMQMAKNDPVLMWVTNAAESCTSCVKLDGQRRRASVWNRLDVRPQHPRKLECMISAGGVDVCKCVLVPVEGGSSRGRLPGLP